MKFNLLILLAIFSFFLFSCDSGLKFDNPLENNPDANNQGNSDAEMQDADSGEPTDSGDSEPTDSGDSEPEDDADTADFSDDSDDSEPDESEQTDDDSADSVPDDDSDPTDTTPDESDFTPDEDADTDSGDSTPDEDADTDSGDSTPDQDTDTDTTPATPCNPNPCNGVANSTQICTQHNAFEFSCGCNSGYFWNGQKCAVLPECSATSGTPCKDSTSGLTWSEKATETMPWQDAINYCNNDTEGGFSSWHLPNIDELRTIFIADRASACQLSETNNCVSMSNCWSCETCMETGIASTSGNTCSNWGTSYSDGRYSKFGETGWFWSSSTQSASSNNAFGISFNVGGISDYARSYDHDVRCVRCEDGYFWNGSTCAVLPECSKTSGTPCKDSTSKLTWSAKAEDTMDWQTAINYCSNYIEGGLSGWHLPNIDELKTLLVWSKASSCQVSEVNDCLALDGCWICSTCTQTGTQSSSGTGCSDWGTSYSDGRYSKFGEIGGFWSSSTRSNSTDTAWYVLFHYGGVSGGYKTNDINVRCVRK